MHRAIGQPTGAATEGREVVPHGGHVLQPHSVGNKPSPCAPGQEVPFQSWLFHGKQAEKTTARLIRQRPTALSSARLAYRECPRTFKTAVVSPPAEAEVLAVLRVLTPWCPHGSGPVSTIECTPRE